MGRSLVWVLLDNNTDILKEMRAFYNDLYSSKCCSSVNLNTFIEKKNIPSYQKLITSVKVRFLKLRQKKS